MRLAEAMQHAMPELTWRQAFAGRAEARCGKLWFGVLANDPSPLEVLIWAYNKGIANHRVSARSPAHAAKIIRRHLCALYDAIGKVRGAKR